MTEMLDQPTPKMRRQIPGLGSDPGSVRQRIEAMEQLLERMFVIPGINKPVGLDVILDIIPGIGTISAAALGSYIAWEARNLRMSKWQVARMAGNIGFDMLLGLIPWVGAIPDFFFRSNTRNVRIIKQHLDKHHPETRTIDVSARR
ncbi:DUF4112 domain-containing protein [Sphingomonas sp. G124]|uniref:DUF4112 domain-containing protein n=2 Tax=Sphingomonas cremea TaxID=2904799 RepID=A0A9X1QKL6_9SPHN|nr:DUF4112 domain-containing protein [Sphingomonas cremea]MCF2515443.1 DUF4112 domain-containing protein [Sphingomonas cremea]